MTFLLDVLHVSRNLHPSLFLSRFPPLSILFKPIFFCGRQPKSLHNMKTHIFHYQTPHIYTAT